jgi:hypothetical protein
MTANGLEVPRDWWRPDAEGVTVRLPSPVLEVRITRADLTAIGDEIVGASLDALAAGEAAPEPVRAEAIPNLGAMVLSDIEGDG